MFGSEGTTALLEAADCGEEAAVRRLLQAGADVAAVGWWDRTGKTGHVITECFNKWKIAYLLLCFQFFNDFFLS